MAKTKKKTSRGSAVALKEGNGNGALALKKSEFGALMRPMNEIKKLIETNVGPGGITIRNLKRIKMPTGGALVWTVPTVRGDAQEKEIEGIVIAQRDARAYWENSISKSGGGSPPDCSSDDGIQGHGDPGGACANCKFSEFGSADDGEGLGQACKQLKVLYVLPKGKGFLPYVFMLPPTSIDNMKTYLLGLAEEGIFMDRAVTKFGLEKTKNKAGIEFARVAPSLGRELEGDEAEVVAAYTEAIKPAVMRPITFDREEVEGPANS